MYVLSRDQISFQVPLPFQFDIRVSVTFLVEKKRYFSKDWLGRVEEWQSFTRPRTPTSVVSWL